MYPVWILRYAPVDSMVELITLEKIKFNKKIIRREGRVDYIYILNQFESVAKKYCTSSYLRLIDLYTCIA